MKKNRISAILVLSLAVAIIFTACASSTPPAENSPSPSANQSVVTNSEENDFAPITPMTVRFGTSASGTTNHTIASGMANILMNNIDVYDLVPEVTTGSQENIRLLYSNSLQMSIAMLDVVQFGYEGSREFANDASEQDPFRYVIGSSPTMVHIFVAEKSKYQNIEDLKGQKWGVGFGAASEFYVPIILDAHGMDVSEINMTSMTLADICNAMADGTVDVGVWISPGGSASIADLAQTTGIRLIDIEESIAEAIMKENSYFSFLEIPQETYPNLKAPGKALATMNIIIARTDLDENFVYNYTKIMYKNTEELSLVSPKAREFCIANMECTDIIPLHPGAERYYKEIGFIQ